MLSTWSSSKLLVLFDGSFVGHNNMCQVFYITSTSHLLDIITLFVPILRSHLSVSRLRDHDDIITWKRCPHYWPFIKKIPPINGGVPSQMARMRGFYIFLFVEQRVVMSVIWDNMTFIWHHSNEEGRSHDHSRMWLCQTSGRGLIVTAACSLY